MRAIFGVLGLVIALALVAVLVKNQLSSSPAAPASSAAPSVQPAPGTTNADTAEPIAIPPIAPGATAEQQSAQIQEQVRKAMEATMQQPRSTTQDK